MKKLMLGLMMAFAANVAMAEIVKNYDLGNGLTATLDDQGVLTIIGSGAMPDWDEVDLQAWGEESAQIKSVVAEGEISVGQKAFSWCSSLASVFLPNATTVGEHAFEECTSLASVFLPNATAIDRYAFNDCRSLASVSLPNVTSVLERAFVECRSLISVSLPKATTVGECAFGKDGSLISVYLPKVASLDWYVFGDCSNLELLVLSWELFPKVDRAFLGLSDRVKIVTPSPKEKIEVGSYKVAVECGDKILSSADYAKACVYYGISPKTAPQVVQEGEIAVKKGSIQSAKAGAISVGSGVVALDVGICSNGNFTAETANWKKAEIADAKPNEDGTVTLTVPVSASSGFMILQSGNMKIGE